MTMRTLSQIVLAQPDPGIQNMTWSPLLLFSIVGGAALMCWVGSKFGRKP